MCKKRQERRHTEKWVLIFPGKSLACSFDWAGIFNEIWVIYREYVSSWSYLPKINLSRTVSIVFFWAPQSRSIWRSFFQLMENSLDTRGSNCVSNMCSFIRTTPELLMNLWWGAEILLVVLWHLHNRTIWLRGLYPIWGHEMVVTLESYARIGCMMRKFTFIRLHLKASTESKHRYFSIDHFNMAFGPKRWSKSRNFFLSLQGYFSLKSLGSWVHYQ